MITQRANTITFMLRTSVKYKKQPFAGSAIKLYRKVRGGNSCLMNTDCGRYTIIGYQPFMIFEGGPLKILKTIQDSVKILNLKKLPKDFPPFKGGAIGYLSYDLGLHLYGIKSRVRNDIGTPGIYFAYYDKVIVIDNKKKQMWFIAFSDKLLKEIEKDLKTSLN
ncbi:MAG: hypothetical protein ABH856_02830, partial [Patescibacteria group bacterium]